MDNSIIIGKVIKVIGIKGEIKINPLTDDMLRFKKLKIIYLNGIPYHILSCRFDKAFVYLKLSGINSRDEAEKLVDEYVEIDRVNAITPQENSYLIVDIIGCRFYLNDGSFIGKVIDVAQYGAADVFTIEKDEAVCRCPFLKKLISKIDIESKVIIADKKEFEAVCIYED